MSKNIHLPNLRIGLEIHVQLSTKTKLFSSSPNKSLQDPNTLISPIDIAIPGSLPRLNKQAVELAVIAGLHLNCKINKTSFFDRKHYSYADLPLGYQITQFYHPIATNGHVVISPERSINVDRIHLETDAGKLLHEETTLLDFNRCGCPLIEIVTAPDFTTIDQVDSFLNILAQTLRYAKVSDCNMSQGNLRVDVNLSIDRNNKWGPRVEIKNLNSFKFIRNAIIYEYHRQQDLNKQNAVIVTETRLFNHNTNTTHPMRNKEDAKDYMYMPDGNIPPVIITKTHFDHIKSLSPETFNNKQSKLNQITNNQEIVNSILFNDRSMYLLEQVLAHKCVYPEIAAKIIAGELVSYLDYNIPSRHVATLCNLRGDNKISNNILKLVVEKVIKEDIDPIEYITVNDLMQITDQSKVKEYLYQVIEKHTVQWEQLKNGQEKLLSVITGKLIQISKGKIDPKTAQDVIKSCL